MAERLVSVGKMYGTAMAISGDLYNYISKECAAHCRKLDTVILPGVPEPMNLYTIDIDTDNLLRRKKNIDKFDFSNVTKNQKTKGRVL